MTLYANCCIVASLLLANGLYGTSMRMRVPVENYQLLSGDQLDTFERDFNKWNVEEAEYGFWLLCDFEFPYSTHLQFQDITPLPEIRSVDFSELSPYSQYIHKKMGVVRGKYANQWKSCPKLISTLGKRQQYWCHWKLAKVCCQVGIKMTKLHAAIRFRQDYLLRDYIDTTIAARKASTDPISNALSKLAGNL